MVEVHPASLQLELVLLRTFERFAGILEVSGQIPHYCQFSFFAFRSWTNSLLTHTPLCSLGLENINRLLKITILHPSLNEFLTKAIRIARWQR